MMLPKALSAFAICCFAFTPLSQAASYVPRLAYIDANEPSKALLGAYWYVGNLGYNGGGSEISGPSLRYGFGETGEKLNLSYFIGSPSMSMDIGISYFKQDRQATLLINSERKGYAFEAGIRWSLLNIIMIKTKENTSFELGLGF